MPPVSTVAAAETASLSPEVQNLLALARAPLWEAPDLGYQFPHGRYWRVKPLHAQEWLSHKFGHLFSDSGTINGIGALDADDIFQLRLDLLWWSAHVSRDSAAQLHIIDRARKAYGHELVDGWAACGSLRLTALVAYLYPGREEWGAAGVDGDE